MIWFLLTNSGKFDHYPPPILIFSRNLDICLQLYLKPWFTCDYFEKNEWLLLHQAYSRKPFRSGSIFLLCLTNTSDVKVPRSMLGGHWCGFPLHSIADHRIFKLVSNFRIMFLTAVLLLTLIHLSILWC